MPIKVKCPECKKELTVRDESAGKQALCPSCKEVFPVPRKSRDDDEEDAPPRRGAISAERASSSKRRPAGETDADDFSVDLPDDEPERDRDRDRPRRSQARDDRDDEDEDDAIIEPKDSGKVSPKRWRVARLGVLFSQIGMGVYLGIWGLFLLMVVFSCIVGGASKGKAKTEDLGHALAMIMLVLFALNQILSLVGTSLTLSTPVQRGSKPMAILSFSCCLSVLVLFGALYAGDNLDNPREVRPDTEGGGLLVLLLYFMEMTRTLFLALYVGAIGKALKDSALKGRALLLYILTPSIVAGAFLLMLITIRIAASTEPGMGTVIILVLVIVACAAAFLVLSLFFFKALGETRWAMQRRPRSPY
jgi:hypothetical protein